MTKKPTVTTLQSGFNSTETLNANFEALRDGFDNTLSLDGSTPNAMEADLDLNGNNIIGATGLLINGTDYLSDVEAAKTAALAAQAAAETAETNAETAETNAESSETAAGLSATAAATSETNAGASETAASGSATASATSATNSATSASEAAASASAASTSETNAATSETNAATSATNAATSATEAETAKTAAETARDSALAALDSFDDRYLGVKTSDPTVDNDGDALLVGALYFNSNTDKLYIYDGAAWQVTTSGAAAGDLISTNNLSDLTSAATARTNLGLGTAATTASTDYATAAQGALADTATQPADLGTAAATASTDYATAAQGTTADTAVQPNDSPTFGAITATNEIRFEGDVGSNALIQKNASTGRDELQIYAGGDAYQTGSRGAGIHLYGNSDNEHDGNFAVLTGPDDNGDGRIIASGREDKTHVTIGNTIWDYVDDGDDHALLNLTGADAQPALLIEGAGATEGDIVTVTGEALQFGHWDKATTTFTERMQISSSGKVGIGTQSPSKDLSIEKAGDVAIEVKSTGTGDADATLILDAADTGEAVVNFKQDGTSKARIEWFSAGSPDLNFVTETGTNGVFDFQPNNSLAMRINSSGNVGIGESSPTEKLVVNGTVKATTFAGDGSAVTGTAKAWVNYNHFSSSVRDSLNVSSVTDNATGELEVNLTNAMSNVNYCSSGSVGDSNHGAIRIVCTNDALGNTSSKVDCLIENSSGTQVDAEYVGIHVIGDLA